MVNATENNEYLHHQQYATADFDRHVQNINDGLSDIEKCIFSEHFDPTKTTLELGCSGGRVSFALESELGFSSLFAVDFVESFIEEARITKAHRGSNITFDCSDVRKLPYRDAKFQQVYGGGVVLSHLVDRKDRLNCLRKV